MRFSTDASIFLQIMLLHSSEWLEKSTVEQIPFIHSFVECEMCFNAHQYAGVAVICGHDPLFIYWLNGCTWVYRYFNYHLCALTQAPVRCRQECSLVGFLVPPVLAQLWLPNVLFSQVSIVLVTNTDSGVRCWGENLLDKRGLEADLSFWPEIHQENHLSTHSNPHPPKKGCESLS